MNIVEIKEHEDGSATMTFDVDKEEEEFFIGLGVRFALMMVAFNISEKEIIEMLMENKPL